MEKNRLKTEIIIILIVFIVLLIRELPNMKKEIGSSNQLMLSLPTYTNVVTMNIDAMELGIITDDKKIISLIFFDKKSLDLYNQKIENKSIDNGINKILKILVNKKTLNNNSTINIIRYKGNYNFKTTIKNNISNINYTYKEQKANIKDLATKNNINKEEEKEILLELIYLSKDFARENKDNKDLLDYKEKTDYVYKKIEEYRINNNITNEDINNHNLDIILIPSDNTLSNYPTSNSYYYIKDNKTYAYIELNINEKIVSYCYNGSIEEYNKGGC